MIVDDLAVLSVAIDGLELLARGLRQSRTTCPIDEYEPDVVRYWFSHWRDLRAAATGVASAGLSPIGGPSRDRLKLVAIKADLEHATDHALVDRLRWHSTARLYRRQIRFRHYLDLLALLGHAQAPPEPSPPLAEAICIELVARQLGWYPHDYCADA